MVPAINVLIASTSKSRPSPEHRRIYNRVGNRTGSQVRVFRESNCWPNFDRILTRTSVEVIAIRGVTSGR